MIEGYNQCGRISCKKDAIAKAEKGATSIEVCRRHLWWAIYRLGGSAQVTLLGGG